MENTITRKRVTCVVVELCNRVKKRQCGQKWSKELTNSSIYKGTLADINESSFNDIKLAHEKVKKNVKSAAPITFTKKE